MEKNEFLKLRESSLSGYLLFREAKKRDIKTEYVKDTDFMILSTNKTTKTLRLGHLSLGISHHAVLIADDKFQTKQFLKKSGISVPKGIIFNLNKCLDNKSIISTFQSLIKPIVLKPALETYGGIDVFTSIKTISQLEEKIKYYQEKKYLKIIMEEQFENAQEYRILVTKEKVAGITLRVPANIIGDGKHTIQELITIKNRNPNRGGHDYKKPLLKIEIDSVVINHLKQQKLSQESIIPKNQQIFLRKNSNLSTGGDSIDYTDKAHPSVSKIALKAVNSIPEMPYAGIDFMTRDITKKQTEGNYCIIEINRAPGIFMHHYPAVGKKRDVAGAILDVTFPETRKNY